MMYLYLVSGLIILLFCGDLLVRGAVALALGLRIPAMIIGLTIVAFGTSAPELVVAIDAALSGAPGISLGNVVGSNIANIFLVLGLPAILYPTVCNQPSIRRNTLLVLAATVFFMLLCWGRILDFWQGALLFFLLLLFLGYSAFRASRNPVSGADDDFTSLDGMGKLSKNGLVTGFFVIAGILGLPLGAHLFVLGGTEIAQAFGVSDAAIGLSLIALGTSLPELATTLVAAIRKQADVAVGSVLGSNLFNILGIMGITAMLRPIPVPINFLWFDLWVMLVAALLIVPFAMAHNTISRNAGILFIITYIAYIYFLFYADQASMSHATG